jgi:hypothetical protein
MLPAVFAETLQQRTGFLGGGERAFQFHLATREVIILDIDNQ